MNKAPCLVLLEVRINLFLERPLKSYKVEVYRENKYII